MLLRVLLVFFCLVLGPFEARALRAARWGGDGGCAFTSACPLVLRLQFREGERTNAITNNNNSQRVNQRTRSKVPKSPMS